jgi:CRP-like cAMP-binding protein
MISRDFLRSVELLAALRPEEAEALAGLAREEVFRKGDVIFRERDPGGRIFVVLSGVVELSKASPGGRSHPVARLERSEVFGEMAAFDGGPRSATATASVVPETRLASWDQEDFHGFLASHPRAATAVLGTLLRKLSRRLRATSEAVRSLLAGVGDPSL